MAAAQKFVAMFVMCLIVVSAMHVVDMAEAAGGSETYKKCFDKCSNECMIEGRGYTECEMKCDTECNATEMKAKLEQFAA